MRKVQRGLDIILRETDQLTCRVRAHPQALLPDLLSNVELSMRKKYIILTKCVQNKLKDVIGHEVMIPF